MVLADHVLIITNGIETNCRWLKIISRQYQILICIGRIGTLEPYFKFWIAMRVSSPLEGATLLDVACNRHDIGIGNCDYCT
jgi:hypothetical protein